MIEEYMLLANKIVAEKVQKIKNKINPFVYRIHEDPEESKISELKNVCKKEIYYCSNITGEGIKKVLKKLENIYEKKKN